MEGTPKVGFDKLVDMDLNDLKKSLKYDIRRYERIILKLY